MTIWKYVIADPETPVLMPAGAEVLHVDTQRGEVCVWALCDPAAPKVERRFIVVGTGHRVPEQRGRFLGTVLFSGGALVFHIWDAA